MKKITMLITPLLLLTPIMFIDLASEDDDVVVKTVENVLLYEVYKIDVSSAVEVSTYSESVVRMVYFYADDLEGMQEFEEALRNREPLPSEGVDISWEDCFGHDENYEETVTAYDLTVYIFGFPVEIRYGYSNTYVQITEWNGEHNWNYRDITEEDRLDGTHSSTNIIAGQDAKVTIHDVSDDASLVLYSHRDSIPLSNGVSLVEIEHKDDYIVSSSSWTGLYPYVSYTIEHNGLPSETSTYGSVFLVLGALSFGIMVWFGRPQKIKD